MAEPKAGDKVFHDSEEDFSISLVKGKHTIFENETKNVTCATADLTWSPPRKGWYLPGRTFRREERIHQKEVIGINALAFERAVMQAGADPKMFAGTPKG